MKKIRVLFVFTATLLLGISVHAQNDQEKLNLPGDNLNLYSVLKLFQESKTLESFEKGLNEEDSKINNLDLDGDNNIDYIKVADQVDGDVHNIVLQVAVSKTENQDVAVIVVQKIKNGQVQIQVIGDEDLYGKNYIIEPNFETGEGVATSTPNPGYTGGTNRAILVENTTTYVIASWPVVQFIYMPEYSVWHSPWYWGYYPVYWRPWRPHFWHEYYGWHYHWNYYYYGHYRHWHGCRYNRWNEYYYIGHRARSSYYYGRRERGEYRITYSRPDLAGRGSEEFVKKYPNAPSSKDRLPVFDKKTGDPVLIKPSREKRYTIERDGKNHPVNDNNQGHIRPDNKIVKPAKNTDRPNHIIPRDRGEEEIKIERNGQNPGKNHPVRPATTRPVEDNPIRPGRNTDRPQNVRPGNTRPERFNNNSGKSERIKPASGNVKPAVKD